MSDAASSPVPVQAPPPVPPWQVSRELLFQIFFIAVFVFLLFQLARILSPFITALMGALIVALIFHPVNDRIMRLVPHPNVAAALTTLLALTTIIVPVLALGWLLLNEATAIVPSARKLLLEGGAPAFSLPAPLERAWQVLRGWLERWQIDVQQMALDSARQLGNSITDFGAALVKNMMLVVFDLVVLVFAVFFFFRDGPRTTRRVLDLVPMEEQDKRLILERLGRTLSAIVRGAFLTASTQGLLAGLAFAVADVRFPVLLGFATALFAVVPVVGAGAIWAPVGLYLLYVGDTWAGVGVLLWGALVVSVIDNFLRPLVIGRRAQLPILLLFVGILGGLQVYGIAGALVSPLVIASVIAFAGIFREQYRLGGSAD